MAGLPIAFSGPRWLALLLQPLSGPPSTSAKHTTTPSVLFLPLKTIATSRSHRASTSRGQRETALALAARTATPPGTETGAGHGLNLAWELSTRTKSPRSHLRCENPQFCQARTVRIDRLGDLGGAPAVLRAVGRATSRLDLPPPAALTGEWFGALAVIAPSVSIQPVSGETCSSGPAGHRRRCHRGGGRRLGRLPVLPGRAPTGDPTGSPRPPAAGPIACCAATATASGGMRACPVRR